MSDWSPIETLQMDGRQVRFKAPGGEYTAPALPPLPLSREQRLSLAKDGIWPDHRQWTPTHWAELYASAND